MTRHPYTIVEGLPTGIWLRPTPVADSQPAERPRLSVSHSVEVIRNPIGNSKLHQLARDWGRRGPRYLMLAFNPVDDFFQGASVDDLKVDAINGLNREVRAGEIVPEK